MFDTLRQDDRPNGMKYFTSLIISLVVHTVVLSVLVVVPLVYFNALHTTELLTFLIATPTLPLPPPTPQPPPVNAGGAAAKPKIVHIDRYEAPRAIPTRVIPCPDEDTVAIQTDTLVNGFGGGPQGTTNGRSITEIVQIVAPRELERPKAPKIPTPVRVGSIQEAKLIHRVEPVYPKIAIVTRVSETVILDLLIDEEGNVANVTVLKGHPLLNAAAVQAVKQWKYSPTIQNGEPVQVQATVTIFFRMR
jgi:periplasmic protein TonB